MPSTRLETAEGWIAGRHAAIGTAIQAALIAAIKIPADDRDFRILEYPADAFLPPPGRGPNYSVLEITLFSGRSLEAKRNLYAALVDAMAPFDLAPTDLKIILVEVARENWGLGGKPGSEIELGFKVEV